MSFHQQARSFPTSSRRGSYAHRPSSFYSQDPSRPVSVRFTVSGAPAPTKSSSSSSSSSSAAHTQDVRSEGRQLGLLREKIRRFLATPGESQSQGSTASHTFNRGAIARRYSEGQANDRRKEVEDEEEPGERSAIRKEGEPCLLWDVNPIEQTITLSSIFASSFGTAEMVSYEPGDVPALRLEAEFMRQFAIPADKSARIRLSARALARELSGAAMFVGSETTIRALCEECEGAHPAFNILSASKPRSILSTSSSSSSSSSTAFEAQDGSDYTIARLMIPLPVDADDKECRKRAHAYILAHALPQELRICPLDAVVCGGSFAIMRHVRDWEQSQGLLRGRSLFFMCVATSVSSNSSSSSHHPSSSSAARTATFAALPSSSSSSSASSTSSSSTFHEQRHVQWRLESVIGVGSTRQLAESSDQCTERVVREQTGLALSRIREHAFTSDWFETDPKDYETVGMAPSKVQVFYMHEGRMLVPQLAGSVLPSVPSLSSASHPPVSSASTSRLPRSAISPPLSATPAHQATISPPLRSANPIRQPASFARTQPHPSPLLASVSSRPPSSSSSTTSQRPTYESGDVRVHGGQRVEHVQHVSRLADSLQSLSVRDPYQEGVQANEYVAEAVGGEEGGGREDMWERRNSRRYSMGDERAYSAMRGGSGDERRWRPPNRESRGRGRGGAEYDTGRSVAASGMRGRGQWQRRVQ